MPRQMNYKGICFSQRSEECSNQNISLIVFQIKMLQQVEVRSSAKRSTRLKSAVRVATFNDFAVTSMIAV
jgi:hypothetical protein